MKQYTLICPFCSKFITQTANSTFYFCHFCRVGLVINMHHQVQSIEFPISVKKHRLIANVAEQKLSLVDMDPSHEYWGLMDRYILTVDYIPPDLTPQTNDQWVEKLLKLMVFS